MLHVYLNIQFKKSAINKLPTWACSWNSIIERKWKINAKDTYVQFILGEITFKNTAEY